MRVLLFLEMLFSSASMENSKQLMGTASEDEIFFDSQLLKYKPTIKFSAIFIDHINYKKYIKQLLLGLRFIYTEQNLQVKMLKFLLRAPKLMLSLL